MVPTLILLDRSGQVLRPSIQQNDARSFGEIIEFRGQVDESDVLQRTGSAITQQSIGPKLLWLRRHEPEVMGQAIRLMGSYDYVVSSGSRGAFPVRGTGPWRAASSTFTGRIGTIPF